MGESLSVFDPGRKSNCKISDFWSDGDWDTQKLNRILDAGTVAHICSLPILTNPSPPRMIWTLSPNGLFSLKSVWNEIRHRQAIHPLLKLSWNPWITPTISIFMIRILHGWLPTRDILQHRGMTVTALCYCCSGIETLPHLFLSGPVAAQVWAHFHRLFNIPMANSMELAHFLTSWRIKAPREKHVLNLVPILILWFLWCGRNDMRAKSIPFTAERVIWRATHYLCLLSTAKLYNVGSWDSVRHVGEILGVHVPCSSPSPPLVVSWVKPSSGTFKLNTDGACRGNPGSSAAGGVLRDHKGDVIFMFSEFLGHNTNTFAEIYAIWRGLDICSSRQIQRVWVETDSQIAIKLLTPPRVGHWQLQYLIQRIHRLMELMEVRFSHIYREGNAVADFLANEGIEYSNFLIHDHNSIVGKLRGLIRLDKIGCPYIRSR